MLTSGTAKRIGKGGVRLAAVLAGLQLPVAVAEVTGHAARVAHEANVDCVGHSMNAAISVGHTALSMLDACVVGQLVHAAGVVIASDSLSHPVQAVVGIVGHEMVAHLLSFVLQTLS
jgi:hypothetical protein